MEEKTKKAYGQAIDILMSGEADYKAICLKLAKEAPETFIALSGSAEPNDTLEGKLKIKINMVNFIKANPGQKVEAIKRYRSLTGWGLKESKDYVDALMNEIDKGVDFTSRAEFVLADLFKSRSGGEGIAPGYKDGGSY